jgi:hypothetical protein
MYLPFSVLLQHLAFSLQPSGHGGFSGFRADTESFCLNEIQKLITLKAEIRRYCGCQADSTTNHL